MIEDLIQALQHSKETYQSPTISYRLYHDDLGRPLHYSMEDLPGAYIEVTAAQYAEGRYDVTVLDGRIKKNIDLSTAPKKLAPSNAGTPCHPDDIMIVDLSSSTHWSLKVYED